jgi:hypothetical protein
VRWRFLVIVAGAPTIRTSATIFTTCHHGQWCRMSLKIRGEGRRFLSQLLEGRKGKVGGSASRYLHRRRKLTRQLGTRARDNVQHARHLSHFVVQTVQCPTHCEWISSPYDRNIDSPGVAWQRERRSITHTIVKGVRVSGFFDGGISTSQWRDAALHE